MEPYLQVLGTGTLYRFSTWEERAGVPHVAAGVYTIWQRADGTAVTNASDRFLYVGHAGRGLTAKEIAAKRKAGERKKALWSRLHTHASGRRSGDQFAIYVADCFVLPMMTMTELEAVAERTLELDALVRRYIADRLAFRWVETPDGKTAAAVERKIQGGHWIHGQPFLNPL